MKITTITVDNKQVKCYAITENGVTTYVPVTLCSTEAEMRIIGRMNVPPRRNTPPI